MTSPITPDMTKRDVRRLLGRPHAKTTSRGYRREMRRRGTHVVGLGRSSRTEYWLYSGVPEGHDTQIVIEGGRVAEVSTPPARR
jgi:hypothetical protein